MRAHPEKRQVENPQADDTTVSSYLIFSIGKQRFAFKSSLIQEIMYGSKIHHLPFVPDYVEGVLNCRGNPYTVINSLKLDNEQNSDIPENVLAAGIPCKVVKQNISWGRRIENV